MKPRYGGGSNLKLHELIAQGHDQYRKVLTSFLKYQDQIANLRNVPWFSSSFPALDSISLYCLLAEWNPRTYVEIGSGHPTQLARASVTNNRLRTRIVSVDLAAGPEAEGFCDEVIRTPLQELPGSFFQDLHPGDVVFMDTSHRSLPNSDVTVFFMDILPRLKPWGLVHLHNIWLPWDYPEDQARNGFSEQYLLGTALLVAQRIKTILPNTFVSRTPELLSVLDPVLGVVGEAERAGCSYWISMV